MQAAQIELPPKLVPVFAGSYRYRGAYGGRGSAKTRNFAKMTAVWGLQLAEQGKTGIILCAREYMNSLEDSSFQEIKTAIQSEPWLNEYYEIGERYIRTKNRRIHYVFSGLRHNLGSIRSKANIRLCWIDEAEDVSEAAWRVLTPTVRESGSEIWATWNPESPNSATHKRLRQDPPENSCIVEMNYTDNPWFPEALEQERQDDERKRPETYEHVWEGAFYEITDAQVFKNKVHVYDFTVDDACGSPLYGMDFGFAQDPTTAVECYVRGRDLLIARSCGKVGLDLDYTAPYFKKNMPGLQRYVIRADSARPESISYLKRHGLPRMKAVKKWAGSVEDGVEFMRSFDRIIVHPDCVGPIKEFRLYSYKIDKRTEDILPDIVDAWNHYIDAIRYALAPLIQGRGSLGVLPM